MTIRIVLIGAESTGKSTLGLELSAHYGAPLTAEFVRRYASDVERELVAEDLGPIAHGQLELEDHPFTQEPAPRLVLHDTNLLSSIIYAHHYQGHCPSWIEERFAAREYDLYLYTQPDIPWVPDPGQRESPAAREALHAIFERELVERDLPFVRVGGSRDERMEMAQTAIDLLLATT